MKIDKHDIEKREKIGRTISGLDVYHTLSKGGLSIISKIDPYTDKEIVLATASHPAIARHQASELDKSISYDESLFKSEGAHPDNRVPLVKFDPHMAYKLGKWHSQQSSQIDLNHPDTAQSALNKMKYLHHTDTAVKNYKASGMSHDSALEEHSKHQKLHHGSSAETMPPVDQAKLEDAYFRKYGKEYPSGVHEMFKSEILYKDRGRITFPADPKINNRQDQQVYPTNLASNKNYIGAKINSTDNSFLQSINNNKKKYRGINDSLGQKKADDISSDSPKNGTGLTVLAGTKKPFVVANKEADPSSVEHEAFHSLINDINQKHGNQEANRFLNHLLSNIDQDTRETLDYIISNSNSYSHLKNSKLPRERMAHKEEVINLLRDLTVNGDRRKSIISNSSADDEAKRSFDRYIKSSWNKVRNSANNFKLNKNEDIEKYTYYLRKSFPEINDNGEIIQKPSNWID